MMAGQSPGHPSMEHRHCQRRKLLALDGGENVACDELAFGQLAEPMLGCDFHAEAATYGPTSVPAGSISRRTRFDIERCPASHQRKTCIEQETHASSQRFSSSFGKRFKKKILDHGFSFRAPNLRLGGIAVPMGHDPRNGILAAREDDLLSGLCARNEPGQVRLGSMDRVCRYSFILAACPLLKKKFA